MRLEVAKCLLVSKVLVADGIMTENERAFLDRAMRTHGLDEQERRAVLDLDGWDLAEPVVSTLPADDKRAFVSSLVDAASSDGRLSPLEAKAVQAISKALGLD